MPLGGEKQTGANTVSVRKDCPLVAVVTPVYNGGAIMERTLRCVQNQTYPNIVHVILDNASKDETADLIRSVTNGRVPVLTRRNETVLNQVDNWNAAMAMTPPEARYVKLLPADDLMRADCIEKMVELAESDPAIDFVTAIESFDGEARDHFMDPAQAVYEGADYARRCLKWEIRWVSAAHMFFRATPDRLKDSFNTDCHPMMDKEFIFRELLHRRMGFVFEPLIYTRYDARTVTARLGGYRPSLIAHLRMLKKLGRAFFQPAELDGLIESSYLTLLRHSVKWRLRGDAEAANASIAALKAMGFKADAVDMARATLGYPVHIVRKLTSGVTVREKIGAYARYEEEEFLSPAPSPLRTAAE